MWLWGCDTRGEDIESQMHVDCSKLDVEWLPDIKVYSNGSKEGTSLIRGQYSDTRDVQISLESMGNVLRMMFGGTDDDEYDLDDIHDEGKTLMFVHDKLKAQGAKDIKSAVLFNKLISHKLGQADFHGLEVPDRYVYGFGLDFNGIGRNIPHLYANEK